MRRRGLSVLRAPQLKWSIELLQGMRSGLCQTGGTSQNPGVAAAQGVLAPRAARPCCWLVRGFSAGTPKSCSAKRLPRL